MMGGVEMPASPLSPVLANVKTQSSPSPKGFVPEESTPDTTILKYPVASVFALDIVNKINVEQELYKLILKKDFNKKKNCKRVTPEKKLQTEKKKNCSTKLKNIYF